MALAPSEKVALAPANREVWISSKGEISHHERAEVHPLNFYCISLGVELTVGISSESRGVPPSGCYQHSGTLLYSSSQRRSAWQPVTRAGFISHGKPGKIHFDSSPTHHL